jgi:hypothetical protein
MRQNQRMIGRDARDPQSVWDVCRQLVQVAPPSNSFSRSRTISSARCKFGQATKNSSAVSTERCLAAISNAFRSASKSSKSGRVFSKDRLSFPKTPSVADSRHEAESAHHST